jgi:hypothetical protein
MVNMYPTARSATPSADSDALGAENPHPKELGYLMWRKRNCVY